MNLKPICHSCPFHVHILRVLVLTNDSRGSSSTWQSWWLRCHPASSVRHGKVYCSNWLVVQHFIATLRVVEGIWLLNWLKRSIDESATGCHEWRNTAVLSLFHFLINPFTNVVTGIRVNTVLPLLLCCRSILIPCRKCVFLCVSTLITAYCITREWLPNMVCSYFASVLMKPTTRPKEHIRGGKYWWSEGVTWMRISHGCVFPVVYTHVYVCVAWSRACALMPALQ